jgi:hypothetical protein
MADSFSYEGRLKNLPDPQKVWMWELYIDIPRGIQTDVVSEDLLLRARTVVIPGRTINPIESNFMGTKAFFPGKTEFTGQVSTSLEEREDQKIHSLLNSWMQYMFDWISGLQQGANKQDLVSDMIIKPYKSNGQPLPNTIKLYNCWPQAIADVSLDYAGAEFVRYEVTWQYDYALPVKA